MSGKFDNKYVRDYYDSYVGNLEEYEQHRWHATPQKEFEYRQMARSIKRALGNERYERALEVGPGDAVWTPLIAAQTEAVHLVEQSGEMLRRARHKLASLSAITYEETDLMHAQEGTTYDLVAAIRCFEYFENKPASLHKLHALTAPGGKLLLVTKNVELARSAGIRTKTIHSDQVDRKYMISMLRDAGFAVERVYPAVFRLKSSYRAMRLIFDALHTLMVAMGTHAVLPFSTYATEAYVYIAKRI